MAMTRAPKVDPRRGRIVLLCAVKTVASKRSGDVCTCLEHRVHTTAPGWDEMGVSWDGMWLDGMEWRGLGCSWMGGGG